MSLSEKSILVERENDVGKTEVFLKRNVREAVLRLKEETKIILQGQVDAVERATMLIVIDEIFGPKLT